jgi:hypothetical protein
VPEMVYFIEELTGAFEERKKPQTDTQSPVQGDSDAARLVG